MPAGKFKSGRFRKVKVKTPGNSTVTHYRQRKPSAPKCGSCNATLHGIPRGTASEMKNLPKTMKRPERAYGGVLCTKCSRQKIVSEVVSSN